MQREIVHLIGTRARGIAGRTDRRHRVVLLLAPRFDARTQLRQPLLTLPGQFLHGDELLLHRKQLGAQVAAHLHEVRLLRRQRLLQQPDGKQDGVAFRRPRRVTLCEISPQVLDLELDFPDVALQRASGQEPQGQDDCVTTGDAGCRHR